MESVIAAIKKNGWKIQYVSDKSGFNKGRDFETEYGKMSIGAHVGSYSFILVNTDVSVYWGFDTNKHLVDVYVEKVADSL